MQRRALFWMFATAIALVAPDLAIQIAMLMALATGVLLAVGLAGVLLFPPPRS